MFQTAEPLTITVQSSKSTLSLINGELVLELRLPTSYRFNEPRYARLLAVTGLTEPVIVMASFVALTPFDSSFRRVLGLSSNTPGVAAPVQGSFIAALSDISLAKLDGSTFEKVPGENIVIHLQIASGEFSHY